MRVYVVTPVCAREKVSESRVCKGGWGTLVYVVTTVCEREKVSESCVCTDAWVSHVCVRDNTCVCERKREWVACVFKWVGHTCVCDDTSVWERKSEWVTWVKVRERVTGMWMWGAGESHACVRGATCVCERNKKRCRWRIWGGYY